MVRRYDNDITILVKIEEEGRPLGYIDFIKELTTTIIENIEREHNLLYFTLGMFPEAIRVNPNAQTDGGDLTKSTQFVVGKTLKTERN